MCHKKKNVDSGTADMQKADLETGRKRQIATGVRAPGFSSNLTIFGY